LQANQTYVVTVGTGAQDLHGNRLRESFSLAFSTGPTLNQGKITGRVYGEGRVEGCLVWAYMINEKKEPDPASDAADYVTQADAEGKYLLSYLSTGRYRLFAVLDKDGDRKYTPQADALGVAPSDVLLDEAEQQADEESFRIAVRDTIGPGIRSVQPIDQHHVDVRFDKAVAKESRMTDTHFEIVAREGEALKVELAYQNVLDATRAHLVTEKQKASVEYALTVRDLFDTWGNGVNRERRTVTFTGSARPDTIRPKLVQHEPADNARSVPLNAPVHLYFSEAMDTATARGHVILEDTVGTQPPGRWSWPNPAQLVFKPTGPYRSSMRYRVVVKADSVLDRFGNALGDGTLRLHFTTLNADTLSAIRGQVRDEDTTATGRIYLRASQVQIGGASYEVSMDKPGPYSFDDVLPGLYLLDGFRDADGNGRYTYGQAVPFIPAERFVVYPDTVKIRPRWPNEGNNITFRK